MEKKLPTSSEISWGSVKGFQRKNPSTAWMESDKTRESGVSTLKPTKPRMPDSGASKNYSQNTARNSASTSKTEKHTTSAWKSSLKISQLR